MKQTVVYAERRCMRCAAMLRLFCLVVALWASCTRATELMTFGSGAAAVFPNNGAYLNVNSFAYSSVDGIAVFAVDAWVQLYQNNYPNTMFLYIPMGGGGFYDIRIPVGFQNLYQTAVGSGSCGPLLPSFPTGSFFHLMIYFNSSGTYWYRDNTVVASCGATSAEAFFSPPTNIAATFAGGPNYGGYTPVWIGELGMYRIWFSADNTLTNDVIYNRRNINAPGDVGTKLKASLTFSGCVGTPTIVANVNGIGGTFVNSVTGICNGTLAPTISPTPAPSPNPTAAPTPTPTTATPTASPTLAPSATPTAQPTAAPSAHPTTAPTPGPTPVPGNPTAAPTASPTVSPTPAPLGFDVFLVMGEGNAVGKNTLDSAYPVNTSIVALLHNSTRYVYAVDPLPIPTAVGGEGVGFATTVAQLWAANNLTTGRAVLIVNCAREDASFTNGEWLPSGRSTQWCLNRTQAVLQLDSYFNLVAILWHQGESDNAARMPAATYAQHLISLSAYVRSVFPGATRSTPWVCGQLATTWMNQAPGYMSLVRVYNAVSYLISATSTVTVPDSAGVTNNTLYFNATAQRLLGAAMYDALPGLLYNYTQVPMATESFGDMGYISFESGLADVSGNGHNATTTGASVTAQIVTDAGRGGGHVYQMPATTPSSFVLLPTLDAVFTITAWMKVARTNQSGTYWLATWPNNPTGANDGLLMLQEDRTQVTYRVRSGSFFGAESASYYVPYPAPLNLTEGTWHFLVWSVARTQYFSVITTCLDGICFCSDGLDYTCNIEQNWDIGGQSGRFLNQVSLGVRLSDTNSWVNLGGAYDDVRFWPHQSLSADQVMAIYLQVHPNVSIDYTTNPTAAPTAAPTYGPGMPTPQPTAAPSAVPTRAPTRAPTALPTLAPTAAPTASPTPAPANVNVAPCNAQQTAYGIGAKLSTSSCSFAGTCSAPTFVGCVNGTVDYAGRPCSAYRRVCTDSELRANCGNTTQTLTGGNCTMICPLETNLPCQLETLVCPAPALQYVAPSRHCSDVCGDGVRSCAGHFAIDGGIYLLHQECICDTSVALIYLDNTISDQINTLSVTRYYPGQNYSYCRVRNLETRSCTAAEHYRFCGLDGALGCTVRRHYATSAVATAWNLYADATQTYSGRHPNELLQYFDQVDNATTGFYLHRLKPAYYGAVPIEIPECLCSVNGDNVQSGLKSPLPHSSLLRWNASWFTSVPTSVPRIITGAAATAAAYSYPFSRFSVGTCGFSLPFIRNTWLRTGDTCDATRAGTCNQLGACTGVSDISSCSTTARSAVYAELDKAWNNTGTNATLALLRQLAIGVSHFIIDTGAVPPTPAPTASPTAAPVGAPTVHYIGNTSAPTPAPTTVPVPTTSPPMPAPTTEPTVGWPLFLGYAQGLAFLAAWRTLHPDNTTTEYWRYALVPNSLSECLPSLQEQMCFSGAPDPAGICSSFVTSTAVANCAMLFQAYHKRTQDVYLTPNVNDAVGLYASTDQCVASLASGSASFINTGSCACPGGTYGRACERTSLSALTYAFPSLIDATPGCGPHGRLVNGACLCDNGWFSRPYEPCSTQTCTLGRVGSDCTGVRSTTDGSYFGGYNGVTATRVPACAHGTVSSPNNVDIVCVCDSGWTGAWCEIPACPVINNQVCNGQASCARQNDGSSSCLSVVKRPFLEETCDVDTYVCGSSNAGGCACQINDRFTQCVNPSNPSSGICNNVHMAAYLSPLQCDVCKLRLSSTGVETYTCVCPPGYTGTFCEVEPCKNPGDTALCSGHGSCANGACTCFSSGAALFVGPLCSTDVTAACGVSDFNNGYNFCNGQLPSSCVQTDGVWGCVCPAGFNPASKCTQRVASPTAAPTAAPSAAPGSTPSPTPAGTPHPTPAPTTANNTLLDISQCSDLCMGGECRWINNNATCVCPEPRVYQFDNATRSCTRNMCPNGTQPSNDRLFCNCLDASLVNDGYGLCRQPLPCTFVGGDVCGPRTWLENVVAAPYESTAAKRCNDGTCVCSGPYRLDNVSGVCVQKCNALHTTGFSDGSCVCSTGYDPATDCTARLCDPGWVVSADPNVCQCAPTVTGPACNVSLCQNGTLQSNFTCACTTPSFGGTLCEQNLCIGTLLANYSCQCGPGGGRTGPACTTNACLAGGTPDAQGYCACITNATQFRPLCNASAACSPQASGNPCKCVTGWTGNQCQERFCLNGGLYDVSNAICRCASGWTGTRCNVSTAATNAPTAAPTTPAAMPTAAPTASPTPAPSVNATAAPTAAPSPPSSSSSMDSGTIAGIVIGSVVAAAGIGAVISWAVRACRGYKQFE